MKGKIVLLLASLIMVSTIAIAHSPDGYIVTRTDMRSEYRMLSGTSEQKIQAVNNSCLNAIMPFDDYTMEPRYHKTGTNYWTVQCGVRNLDTGEWYYLWSGYSKEGRTSFRFHSAWIGGSPAPLGGNYGPMDQFGGKYPSLEIV